MRDDHRVERDKFFEDYFRREPAPAKIGFFSLGHEAYWPQFEGLKETLLGYHKDFVDGLRSRGLEVVDAGMSDNAWTAFAAGDKLRAADVDLVICYHATYGSAAHAFATVQRAGRPVVLAALQPTPGLDCEKGTTFQQLCNDQICALPELMCALRRGNLVVADIIVGQLYDDEKAWRRIEDWGRIARVLHVLRNARIGLMGHVYEGMLDMNSDPTMFDAHFGMHVEHLELDDLHARVKAVTDAEVDEHLALIRKLFYFPEPGADPIAGPCEEEDLRWSARVSLGTHRLVEDFGLDGLAYYYRGLDGNENEMLGCSLIVGASLLTGNGVPIAGELDVKNCVAMLIMDRLGAGGSFTELHPLDFREDFVLVGHDGPHHMAVAEGRPVLRGLTVLHGKRGYGASVEFSLKHGPISILGLTQTHDGRFKFVIAEGESLPGPIPATGNTNTRGKFRPDAPTFVENWSLAGPTHHFALGIGHQADVLMKLANVLGIEAVNVTA
jgi:L-arabinose isomerase